MTGVPQEAVMSEERRSVIGHAGRLLINTVFSPVNHQTPIESTPTGIGEQ